MTAHERKKAVGVIPARWASTRLPGKPLALIAGRPMILRVAERAVAARRLDAVLVATDDLRIAEAVDHAGIEGVRAVMTRSDHPTGTDRIAEAVAGVECDAVVNIQGDEPLIDPELIDRLAGEILTGQWDMATAAAPMAPEDLGNPAAVKAVFGRDGQALYFSRAAVPFVRDGGTDTAGAFWRHIGIYAYRRDYLIRLVDEPPCPLENIEKLEQLRALYVGCRMKVVTVAEAAAGVDTPEDIAKVEKILQTRGLR